MPHSPPVPPANQSPYPLVEAPHDHHAAPPAKQPKPRHPKPDNRVRNGVVAALGIGAVAALVAGLVVATRQPAKPPAPHKKPGGPKKRKH